MISLVTTSEGIEKFNRDAFIQVLKDLWGDRLGGVQHTINDNTGDRVEATEGNSDLIYGAPKVVEELNGLKFEIDMKSFFQTNPKSAELLYDKAISYALERTENGAIMDLFCGTGTIAQLIAQRTDKEVIGVDIVHSAIEDAKRNADRNGVSTAKFFASDVGKFLLEYPNYTGQIGTIVLDPPRGGISPKTLRKVMRLNAPRIVYISCNPATQARDTKDMSEFGYKLVKWSLVDQFPHTAHVEAIALFEKI